MNQKYYGLELCNRISLCHEQVCWIEAAFGGMLPRHRPDDERSFSQSAPSIKDILVHDSINLLCYEHWKGKQKYFYEYQNPLWWSHSSKDTETKEKHKLKIWL